MFRKSLRSMGVALIACVMLTGCSVFGPKLKANDRVVFFGDSITYFGNQPGGYVTLVREAVAKSHPGENIEIIGAGISGNKIGDLLGRVENDVMTKKPTVVVVYIGINDVWHWRRNQGTTQDVFEDGLNKLVDRFESAGARVILVTPSVIGEKKNGANKWDKWLDEFAGITKKVAQERKLQCIDLRTIFKDYDAKHNPEDAEQGILTKDTVHLNPTGDKLVANEMLKALGSSRF